MWVQKHTFVSKTFLVITLLIITSLVVFSAEWILLVDKPNWDYSSFGKCDDNNYCFVGGGDKDKTTSEDYYKTKILSSKPKCLKNKDFIKDFYCDNGSWTTRTKFLAVELLAIASKESPNNYILFCGDLNTVSIKDNQFLTEKVKIKQVHEEKVPRANTACVLKYDKGTALALSINTLIDDKENSPLNIFNVDTNSCDNAKKSTIFTKCNTQLKDFNIYYNDEIKGLLYLPKGSSPKISSKTFTSEQAIEKFFTDPFNTILDYIKNNYKTFSFSDKTNFFQNVYVAKRDSKKIFAFSENFLEKKNKITELKKYIGVNYSGFDIGKDPCRVVKETTDEFKCIQSRTGDLIIFSDDETAVSHWVDLTSSLRLK